MVLLLSLSLKSSVLQPLYRTLLPKIKVNRNFPIVITLVSVALGELGLPSLEVEQVLEVIDLMISLYNSPTPAKFLLRDSLELLQLESGLVQHILKSDYV